jgi:hypothetical protein
MEGPVAQARARGRPDFRRLSSTLNSGSKLTGGDPRAENHGSCDYRNAGPRPA